jgi:hypothetical protein
MIQEVYLMRKRYISASIIISILAIIQSSTVYAGGNTFVRGILRFDLPEIYNAGVCFF